jgi:hypothetical protein
MSLESEDCLHIQSVSIAVGDDPATSRTRASQVVDIKSQLCSTPLSAGRVCSAELSRLVLRTALVRT